MANGRVQNVSYTFGPTGTVLGRSAKRYLTAGLESRLGLSRAASGLNVLETPAGRVGVALCLDGFYSSVLETFDGFGRSDRGAAERQLRPLDPPLAARPFVLGR